MDLFGSDDEEENKSVGEQQPSRGGADEGGEAGPSERNSLEDPVEDLFGDSDDGAEQAAQTQRETLPYATVSTNFKDRPKPNSLRLIKTSNVLNIEVREFDPDTYVPEATEEVDNWGRQRVNLRHLNTVRWRTELDESGNKVQRSNARIVRWPDGSSHLYIGSEALSITEAGDPGSHRYLFVRRPAVMQVCDER